MSTLRFLIAALVFGFATHPAAGQIELDAGGNVSIGNVAPAVNATLFVKDAGDYIGIETRSENAGSNRYGIITRATSGSTTYGV